MNHYPVSSVGQSPVPSSLWVDACVAVYQSRIARAFAVSYLSTATFVFYASNPTGLAIGAFAATALAVSLVAQYKFDLLWDAEKLYFEGTSFSFLMKMQPWKSEIHYEKAHANDGKIFLTAMPNRLANHAQEILKNHVKRVLSVNAPWERDPLGFAIPYQSAHWNALNIDHATLDVIDHRYLTFQQLDAAAALIKDAVEVQKQNILVHCKSGRGRSALAIAAYLIKYRKLSASGAAECIVQSRPISTIKEKLGNNRYYEDSPGLEAYEKYCRDQLPQA